MKNAKSSRKPANILGMLGANITSRQLASCIASRNTCRGSCGGTSVYSGKIASNVYTRIITGAVVLRCIRAWDKRVVTREIRKKAGELNQVAETIKLVEDNTGRKKRKTEPSETTKAKEEKRGVMKQRFIGS